MTLPITREQALKLIEQYNEDAFDIIHYIESEAIMGALAKRLGEDEEYWKMLGLLHDIDWGITKGNTREHLTKAPEILKKAGFDDKFIKIILSHGYGFDCAGLKEKVENCEAIRRSRGRLALHFRLFPQKFKIVLVTFCNIFIFYYNNNWFIC